MIKKIVEILSGRMKVMIEFSLHRFEDLFLETDQEQSNKKVNEDGSMN